MFKTDSAAEDLQICSLTPTALLQTCAPVPPRTTSIVAKLVRLALDIFDGVCRTPAFRPARHFHAIVQNACSLVLATASDTLDRQNYDIQGMQSLLDLINDSGLEWPGNFLDKDFELAPGWGVDGMTNI